MYIILGAILSNLQSWGNEILRWTWRWKRIPTKNPEKTLMYSNSYEAENPYTLISKFVRKCYLMNFENERITNDKDSDLDIRSIRGPGPGPGRV